jgi:hypothetical protein
MPAKSKQQQKFFAIVKDVQSGKRKASSVTKDVKDAANDTKKADVEDFVTTKTKSLPKKVKKDEEYIRKFIQSVLLSEAGLSDGDVIVPGVGKYSYKSLKRNVENKLTDMLKKIKQDDYSRLNKRQFDLLFTLWSALAKYVEDQK